MAQKNIGVAGININYTDNEKPSRNHWKLTEKVSTATLFSHGFDLSAHSGKKRKIMEITNFSWFLIVLLFLNKAWPKCAKCWKVEDLVTARNLG